MLPSDFDLPPVGQIGIVVRDVKTAMDHYSRILGIGPWTVHTNSAPPLVCTYKGRPANYRVVVAMARAGSLTFELIQYLEGDTIHRDFAKSRGEGVEHIGMYVPNLDEALAAMRKAGVSVLQQADGTGYSRDGRYAYLDTEATLGTVLEFIQPASQRTPSSPLP